MPVRDLLPGSARVLLLAGRALAGRALAGRALAGRALAGWAGAGRTCTVHGPVRPPRLGQEHRYGTAWNASALGSWPKLGRGGLPAIGGAHQPQPSRSLSPRWLCHRVLAAELAAHAAACRGPPSAGRQDGREQQRGGDGGDPGPHDDRGHDGGGVEEMPERPAEHQQRDDHDDRQPGRWPGITDHRQPLRSGVIEVGRAPLPSHSCIPQPGRKVKPQRRLDVSAA